jgi:hypothetical protein
MNEQSHVSGRASFSAYHAGTYSDSLVAHGQDSLPALPTFRHGVKEASDLLTRLFRGFNEA